MSEEKTKEVLVREDLLSLLLPIFMDQGWVATSVDYDSTTIPSIAFVILTKE